MPEPGSAISHLRDGFILLGSALAFVLLFRRVLLLFVAELELAPARLWRLRHSIFLFGKSQVPGPFPAHPANPRSSRACRGMPRNL